MPEKAKITLYRSNNTHFFGLKKQFEEPIKNKKRQQKPKNKIKSPKFGLKYKV